MDNGSDPTRREPIAPPIVRRLKKVLPVATPIVGPTEESFVIVKKAPVQKMAVRTRTNSASLMASVILVTCFILIAFTALVVWPQKKYVHRGLGFYLGARAFGGKAGLKEYDRKYPWHEEILDNPKVEYTDNYIANVIIDSCNTDSKRYRWDFSINKFFASFSGWFVIVNFVIFFSAAVVCCQSLVKGRQRCSRSERLRNRRR